MVSRKRARTEMEAEEPTKEPTTLDKLRNMWQFANLMQYIALFGDVIKIDREFDIQALETECLMPQPSVKLAEIGLALLKHVSSHKGLTLDIFDEYARRQYVAKAPQRNPFGTEEIPNQFNDFDVFTKIKVLQQLSAWTFFNPNHIRERMAATEAEQALWRMEPLGWDSDDREIFVLDDNRLYRRTQPPPPPPPTKSKSKAKKRKSKGTRSSKRRKVASTEPENGDEDDSILNEDEPQEDDGLGGMKWECICITLEDYQNYMESIRKSKDPNEKELYQRIEADVIPAIEQEAEEQAKREARKLKELEVLQKLASAKRSTRISAKQQRQKELEEAAEAERKRQADLAMAKAEQEKQRRMEEARESRMMTREQRLKEREAKRILHEEELRRLKEDSAKLENNEGRLSERHLKAEMKRREEELQKLTEEEDWIFDCSVCGLHGQNLDDGSHSIQCEKCKAWQHSKCHKIDVSQAERDDFHFVCNHCKHRELEAKTPKHPSLKLRLSTHSPKTQPKPSMVPNGTDTNGVSQTPKPQHTIFSQAPVSGTTSSQAQPIPFAEPLMNGPSLSPRGQTAGPPGIRAPAPPSGVVMPSINGAPASIGTSVYSTAPAALPPANGIPSSPPPQGTPARPYSTPGTSSFQLNNYNLSFPPANGSPSGAFPPPASASFSNFGRPSTSAAQTGHFGSPVKHSPAPSPRQPNGITNAHAFPYSPNSSFPPRSLPAASVSPMKHSSPPPAPLSSPRPVPPHVSTSPLSQPALLPDPVTGLSPEKHDGARPVSSHGILETPIFPPAQTLSPTTSPQAFRAPHKKPSPTPERPHSSGIMQS